MKLVLRHHHRDGDIFSTTLARLQGANDDLEKGFDEYETTLYTSDDAPCTTKIKAN